MTTSVSGTLAAAMESQDVDTLILGDSSCVEDAGTLPHFERKGNLEQVALFCFIAIAFLAIVASIPVAWNRALNWHDAVIATLMYAMTGHGITVGFHRYFTHRSFRATRWLRIALAVAGWLAIEGPVIRWVADHRRHHAFSDRQGNPHLPWRNGETVPALVRGLWWAHIGWLFDVEQTSRAKYAPDLMGDKDMRRVNAAFPALVAVSIVAPAEPVVDVLAGSGDGLLLGVAGAHRPAPPRDLVDQLDLPRHRQTPVRQPGQVSQSLVAGGLVHGRVLAQPPPRRPDLRPSWSRGRPARRQRPHHLGFRGAGLGLLGPLATCRKGRRQTRPANRTKHKGLCSDMMAW
jgi:hypothetical protein